MHANTIKYIVKQYMKMLMQGFFLPVIYQLYRHIPVQSHRVVFADAHHENLPFSMQAMHQTMKEKGYEVIEMRYLKRKKQVEDGKQMETIYTFEEIAEILGGQQGYNDNLNEKTVRGYKNTLIHDMAIFLFGSDAI